MSELNIWVPDSNGTSTTDDDVWSSSSHTFTSDESIEESSSEEKENLPFFQSKKFWQCQDDDSSLSSSSSADIDTETQSINSKRAPGGNNEEQANTVLRELHHEAEKGGYMIVNVIDYLKQIEEKVIQQGETLSMVITKEHRKTMLRTLLGMDKLQLDRQLKEAKLALQDKRIMAFLCEVFQPFLIGKHAELDMDIEQVQHIMVGLETLKQLRRPPNRRADRLLAYMARGALYKGDFVALLQDLAPELVESYFQAKDGITEQDIMTFMVDGMDPEIVERIEDVKKCISCQLPQRSKQPYARKGQQDGLVCEHNCLDFLCKRYANVSTQILVLPNVLVKTRKPRGSTQISNVFEYSKVQTAIMETSVVRQDGSCEEFDALVVETCNSKQDCVVREVWEAKASINPSTLQNAIQKKLPSLHSLIYSQATLHLCEDQIPLSLEPVEPFLFGLYGTSLQSVDKAANQARVIACHQKLAKSADAVARALDSGKIEIDCQAAMVSLRTMRVNLAEYKWLVVVVKDNNCNK